MATVQRHPRSAARRRLLVAFIAARVIASLRRLVVRNSALRRQLSGVLFKRSARFPIFYPPCDCKLEARAFIVGGVALPLHSIRGITVSDEARHEFELHTTGPTYELRVPNGSRDFESWVVGLRAVIAEKRRGLALAGGNRRAGRAGSAAPPPATSDADVEEGWGWRAPESGLAPQQLGRRNRGSPPRGGPAPASRVPAPSASAPPPPPVVAAQRGSGWKPFSPELSRGGRPAFFLPLHRPGDLPNSGWTLDREARNSPAPSFAGGRGGCCRGPGR
ncbi:hypothetical protein EMIHUDRAFT_98793 [Emiliania huxleyi CCMP1516]|uniref:PH domain-containing protein n=2 Tax=Emiliania huxleyi TaxID=2903 RepID=A0A0D3KBF3_EMIH1|nr:hypothetical protein EMIHUDRAFT_98793 [Emiliania huxleyi CCMP1516]EOD33088.1 hypothetical protein EMIHUDRAFT_98793 [Emiliania huxleyi CCMP1516]|eukprot:XP_005785517.1 hypothetical protein EMIHUDRAFT_98793 [Emiliania huxleyi CCMP1516]